jgi:hypothetical protein
MQARNANSPAGGARPSRSAARMMAGHIGSSRWDAGSACGLDQQGAGSQGSRRTRSQPLPWRKPGQRDVGRQGQCSGGSGHSRRGPVTPGELLVTCVRVAEQLPRLIPDTRTGGPRRHRRTVAGSLRVRGTLRAGRHRHGLLPRPRVMLGRLVSLSVLAPGGNVTLRGASGPGALLHHARLSRGLGALAACHQNLPHVPASWR